MEVLIEKRSKSKQTLMMVILGALLVLAVINLNDNVSNTPINNLNVKLYSTEMPIKVGNSTTLQVLVNDENEGALDDAKLNLTLTDEHKVAEPLKEQLLHVENGLYEVEVQFLKPGNWEAVVELRVGKSYQQKVFPLFVEVY